MNAELFDLNETLSPRLVWQRMRGIELKENTPNPDPGAADDLGNELHRWYAGHAGVWIGGATQDEALVNLCKYKGWRLWNEPETKPQITQNPADSTQAENLRKSAQSAEK